MLRPINKADLSILDKFCTTGLTNRHLEMAIPANGSANEWIELVENVYYSNKTALDSRYINSSHYDALAYILAVINPTISRGSAAIARLIQLAGIWGDSENRSINISRDIVDNIALGKSHGLSFTRMVANVNETMYCKNIQQILSGIILDSSNIRSPLNPIWNLEDGLHILASTTTTPTVSTCDHDLKQYHGFTENYNYCTKCNHKE